MSKPMKRGCFLSGEATVTMPLCMTRAPTWDHRMTPMPLAPAGPGTIRRGAITYDAVLCYFSLDDDALRASIHQALIDSGVACWPDAGWLPTISDRRELLIRAQSEGLLHHPLRIVTQASELTDACTEVGFPVVVKVGNQHSGLGKYRVREPAEIAEAVQAMEGGGFATVEPFFEGTSYRIFVAGARGAEETVCVRYDNSETWVKNAPGCDVVSDHAPSEVVAEAIRAHQTFQYRLGPDPLTGTLLSGVDYLREDAGGQWRFLEWNGFPWLGNHPDVERLGRATIEAAMSALEARV